MQLGICSMFLLFAVISVQASINQLHNAVDSGKIQNIEDALEELIDINEKTKTYGETVLHRAARKGNMEMVKSLVAERATIDEKDNFGYTPLWRAVDNGFTEIVDYLINKGVEVNMKTFKRVKCPSKDINPTEMKSMVESGMTVDIHSKTGDSYLHRAALRGYNDIVNSLIQANADVHRRNCNGETALELAALRDRLTVVKTLVKANADIHAKTSDGPLLHRAARRGNLELVSFLLQSKVNVASLNRQGQSALHGAACSKNLKLVEFLIKAKAPIDLEDSQGMSAVVIAAVNNVVAVVKVLQSFGAKMNFTFDAQQDDPLSEFHEAMKERIRGALFKDINQ